MLILTRKDGEGLHITHDIHVRVLEQRPRTVRLEITDEGAVSAVSVSLGEALAIRPGVSVQVMSMRPGRFVRLGIDAPQSMNVWRDELGADA